MFGVFGLAAYFSAYHKIIPKSPPVEEYDDRVELYTLSFCSISWADAGIIN